VCRSDNDSVTSQAQRHDTNYGGCSQGYVAAPVSRCLHAAAENSSDVANVTCCGRLFQTRAALTGKARSPIDDNRIYGDDEEAEPAAKPSGWLDVLTAG